MNAEATEHLKKSNDDTDGALERTLYRLSPEGGIARSLRYKLLGATATAVFCLYAGMGLLAFNLQTSNAWRFIGFGLLAMGFAALLTAYVLSLRRIELRRAYEDRKLLELRGVELAEAAATMESAGEDDPSALVAYWKATHQRLDSYHAEAGSQLRGSYRLAQAAALFGFLTVLALGVAAAVAPTSVNAAVTGGIAALGAALAAFIGKTFQSTYERALSQRMSYFAQPVVAVRLLQAERLISRLDGDAHDKAVLAIIEAAVSFDQLGGH